MQRKFARNIEKVSKLKLEFYIFIIYYVKKENKIMIKKGKKAFNLLQKTLITYKKEGLNSVIDKTKKYMKNRKEIKHKNNYKDILFINGCGLEHPRRYRVQHQIEQLEFVGYSCDEVWYENLTLDKLKFYRGFIFYRCPSTPLILSFIETAKVYNKTTFFDIDDLVIDKKYVEKIKYLNEMSKEDYNLYMDGVNRMQETLRHCDYGITTTKTLARELENYISEVYINRNVSSEKMLKISEDVLKEKEKLNAKSKQENKIYLGYMSGSITHNPDFELISPVIKRLLKKYDNVYLSVVGFLDVPENLKEVEHKIVKKDFVNWKKLPKLISELDINLVPLEESVFNEAKSENKWVEAGLVKTVTVASAVGPFKDFIKNGETGYLCTNEKEWEETLENLIQNENLRKKIAEKTFNIVRKENVTAYTGMGLAHFLESKLKENILFVLPSTQISGGVNVVKKHCNILREHGYDVTILSMDIDDSNVHFENNEINVVLINKTLIHAYFKKAVGTLWSTMNFIITYPKIKEKKYLVQGFETDFYKSNKNFRKLANTTYNFFNNVEYLTISKWCQDWLENKYFKKVKFAPNGINTLLFKYKERNFEENKIKILIEGNSEDYYKNVDESFKIVEKLDKNKYEIIYLSYKGDPKDWYRVDKFYNKIPHEKVSKVYREAHILLKTSILESFSYPPLEMMATGGISVVIPNSGNVEYLKNEENCLFFKHGNIDEAVKCIEKIVNNVELREKIIRNGLNTVKEREWRNIENEIIKLYN